MNNLDSLLNQIDVWESELEREKKELQRIEKEKTRSANKQLKEELAEYQKIMKKVGLDEFYYKTIFNDYCGREIYMLVKQTYHTFMKPGIYQDYVQAVSRPTIKSTVEWWKTVDKEDFYKEFFKQVRRLYIGKIRTVRVEIDKQLTA